MRKFIFNIVAVCLAAAFILCLITWMGVRKIDNTDFRLPEDVHSIAIGPSTMQGSLNDTLLSGLQNFSRNGTHLSYIVPLLPKILEQNPQIDTVYINHGRFMYLPKPNEGEAQKMQSLRDKLPFIWYKREIQEWGKLLENSNFYAALLNPDWKEIFRRRQSICDYGFRFESGISHNLYDRSKSWSVAWYDSIIAVHGGNKYMKEEVLKECATADKYSRMAIDFCHRYHVVPVLFFTPLYHYERWFPYDTYIEVMKDYDPEILVADYENFEFSNDSLCRRDVHHLNIYGANEFSTHLARNGIQKVRLKDWIESKSVY